MEIFQKLKTDRKFLITVIGILVAVAVFPYITIFGLILWWFYKKSKLSKKVKIIVTSVVLGLFILLITGSIIAYVNDVEPTLNIAEPSTGMTVKGPQVTIKGTYQPNDRNVRINNEPIPSSNGSFEYIYDLNVGENTIEISAGNWKWADVTLIVIRELTDEEIAANSTPIPTPSPTPEPTQELTPEPTPTTEPTKAPGYTEYFSFSGSGPKNSEQFTITGDRFRVRYDCTGDLCQAFLHKLGDDLFLELLMNSAGPVSDETVIYNSGTFYIQSNSIGNYFLIVDEYK